MRDGNLSSGEIKTRAAFLRRILRHNRLSRDAHLRRILRHSRLLGGCPHYAVNCAYLLPKGAFLRTILRNHLPRTAFLRRILRIFPAPRKGFITHYTAYRFPSLKDAFHALGGMTPAFVFPSFVPAPGFPSLSRISSVPSSPLFPFPALPSRRAALCAATVFQVGASPFLWPPFAVRFPVSFLSRPPFPYADSPFPFSSLSSRSCGLGATFPCLPHSLQCPARTPPRPQEKRTCPNKGKNALLYLK